MMTIPPPTQSPNTDPLSNDRAEWIEHYRSIPIYRKYNYNTPRFFYTVIRDNDNEVYVKLKHESLSGLHDLIDLSIDSWPYSNNQIKY